MCIRDRPGIGPEQKIHPHGEDKQKAQDAGCPGLQPGEQKRRGIGDEQAQNRRDEGIAQRTPKHGKTLRRKGRGQVFRSKDDVPRRRRVEKSIYEHQNEGHHGKQNHPHNIGESKKFLFHPNPPLCIRRVILRTGHDMDIVRPDGEARPAADDSGGGAVDDPSETVVVL